MTQTPSMELADGAAPPGEHPPATGAPSSGFFGHPRGLATLFFTELWERFSYYGMRAILILFMVAPEEAGGMGLDTVRAGAIYGLYTGMVYLMALPGGWVADRLIGQRHAVLLGGIVIAAGHFSMAVPSDTTFFLGLVLIVLGTGLLKPNISAMVGELYPEGGARRDAGFSIFYMGINIGAFLSPLVCGYLGEKIDWHYGFGAAGVGMVLGVIQYMFGGKYLGTAGAFVPKQGDPGARSRDTRAFTAALAGVVAVLALVIFLRNAIGLTLVGVASGVSYIIVTVAAVYFAYLFIVGGLKRLEKGRTVVIAILFVCAAIFWAGFEQAGSSLNLFAAEKTDRVLFNWEMPASWLQSVNALFIIILAPVFAWLWVWLSKRRLEPSSPAKFSLGLVQLGMGFGIMVLASLAAANGQQVSPMWLVLTYLLHTTGELCVSPVGLSTVTKLAPERRVGQMMGVWFMGTALGNVIAGQVGGQFEALPLPNLFGMVFLFTAGPGLLLALFIKPIRRWMGGIH